MKKRFLFLFVILFMGTALFSSCSCSGEDYTYVGINDYTDTDTREGYDFWIETDLNFIEDNGKGYYVQDSKIIIRFEISRGWLEKEGEGFKIEFFHDSIFSLTHAERQTIISQMDDYREDRLEEELSLNDDRTEEEIKAEIEEEMRASEEFCKYFPIEITIEESNEDIYVTIEKLPHEIGFVVSGIERNAPIVTFHSTMENLNKFDITINGTQLVNETTKTIKAVDYEEEIIIKIASKSPDFVVPNNIYYYKDGPVYISMASEEETIFKHYKYKGFFYEDSTVYNLPDRLTHEQLMLVVNNTQTIGEEDGYKIFNLGNATGDIHLALSMNSTNTFDYIMKAYAPKAEYENLQACWEEVSDFFGNSNFKRGDELFLNFTYFPDSGNDYSILRVGNKLYEYDFSQVEFKFFSTDSGEEIEGVQWQKYEEEEVQAGEFFTREITFKIIPPQEDFMVELVSIKFLDEDKNSIGISDIAGIFKLCYNQEKLHQSNIFLGFSSGFTYAGEYYLLQSELNINVSFYDMEIYESYIEGKEADFIVAKTPDEEVIVATSFIIEDFEFYQDDEVLKVGKMITYAYSINSDISLEFMEF